MDTTNFKNMRVGENEWGWEKWMRVGENEWEREKEWEKNEREMNGTIQYTQLLSLTEQTAVKTI